MLIIVSSYFISYTTSSPLFLRYSKASKPRARAKITSREDPREETRRARKLPPAGKQGVRVFSRALALVRSLTIPTKNKGLLAVYLCSWSFIK